MVAAWILGLAPLVVLPGGLDPFTIAKIAVGAGACAVLVAGRGVALNRRLTILVVVGLALICAGLFGSSYPAVQVWGREPRLEGLIVGAAYALFLLAGISLTSHSGSAATITALMRGWAIASVGIGVVAALELMGWEPFASGDRVASLFGNASDLGAFAVLTLGVLGYRALRGSDLLTRAGTVAAAVSVVACASRAALVAAVLVALVLLAGRRDRRTLVVTLASALTLSALVLTLPVSRGRVLGSSPLAARTITGRLDLWNRSVDLLTHRPLGLGAGGFVDAIPSTFDQRWYEEQPFDLVLDSPHSLPLQWWSMGGLGLVLVGLALLLTLVVHGWSSPWIAGLIGYVAVLVTHFSSPMHTPWALLLAGLIAGSLPGPSYRVGLRAMRTVAAVAGVVALTLAAGALAEVPRAAAFYAVEAAHPKNADAAWELATRMRPWSWTQFNGEALHAYAVVARSGVPAAADAGAPYVARLGTALGSLPSGYRDAASIAAMRGDHAAAAALLEQALARDGSNPQLLVDAGALAGTMGDFDRAERLLLLAASTLPHNPAPWGNLAVVRTARGDAVGAAEARSRADALTAAGGTGSGGAP